MRVVVAGKGEVLLSVSRGGIEILAATLRRKGLPAMVLLAWD